MQSTPELIREQPVVFNCDGETLVGIISHPPHRPSRRGVLIVVGGPQYRVGSHRQFVLIARRIAAAGFPAFRFDYRGMGDASGALRAFDGVEDDIRSAADAFMSQCREVREIVVWGLCDAASAALMFATSEPRFTGLVLVNPWVRSAQTLARTHLRHYYVRRLLDPGFWRHVIRGTFSPRRAVRSALGDLVLAATRADRSLESSFIDAMRAGVQRFRGHTLLVLSGNDLTAKEFENVTDTDPGWHSALNTSAVTRVRIEAADHTFSTDESRAAVENETVRWLQSL